MNYRTVIDLMNYNLRVRKNNGAESQLGSIEHQLIDLFGKMLNKTTEQIEQFGMGLVDNPALLGSGYEGVRGVGTYFEETMTLSDSKINQTEKPTEVVVAVNPALIAATLAYKNAENEMTPEMEPSRKR